MSFDSTLIAKRSNSKYANALLWIESELELPDHVDRPTSLLSSVSWQGQAFLLKLSIVRAFIDEIASIINSETVGDARTQLLEQLAKITTIFQAYISANGDISRLAELGFDMQYPLTEPFPFVTSAWCKPSYSLPFNESLEVERLFMKHMSKEAGAEKCVLREMPENVRLRAEECLDFLQSISEKLLHDISIHVRHLVMIDFERWSTMTEDDYREIGQSISSHLVPSCCFFSWHSISKKEKFAEAIYHEALHKKLSNILIAESIFKQNYSTKVSPKFLSYWNHDTEWNPRYWEFDRALYAFHVYTHLVVFYGVLLEERPELDISTSFSLSQHQLAVERATALGEWLTNNAPQCVTERGMELIEALHTAVQQSIRISQSKVSHCC